MKFATFSAFQNDGYLIQLIDFLSVIPENNWVWVILDFYGAGNAPCGLTMEEFETLVRTKSGGVIMTWLELNDFAKTLGQTYDCLIVATKSTQNISEDRSVKENFSSCEIVIEAFDSTDWSFGCVDDLLIHMLEQKFSG